MITYYIFQILFAAFVVFMAFNKYWLVDNYPKASKHIFAGIVALFFLFMAISFFIVIAAICIYLTNWFSIYAAATFGLMLAFLGMLSIWSSRNRENKDV